MAETRPQLDLLLDIHVSADDGMQDSLCRWAVVNLMPVGLPRRPAPKKSPDLCEFHGSSC